MVEIKVDLNALADNVLEDEIPFIIGEYDIEMKMGMDDYEELIHNFISTFTPVTFIITEPAMAHIQEELFIIIKKKLYLRLKTIYNDFDAEDIEVEDSEFRYYEVEEDL